MKKSIKNGDTVKVKELENGDVVEINFHDYFYKGKMNVLIKGLQVPQYAFWSITTDFKKYFNLALEDLN